jgi:mRNA interferase RelE/StbE
VTQIQFTNDAIDDLRRLGPEIVPRILKKILILEINTHAGQPLGGPLTGFRKLVAGNNTWRIVYRAEDAVVEICEIWAVGARAEAEVYAEATLRVRAAAETRPGLVPLAEVIERLGRLAEGVHVATPLPAEPVPDWLADRLIYTVRLPREEVAAMDLQQAVDTWAKFTAGPDAPDAGQVL